MIDLAGRWQVSDGVGQSVAMQVPGDAISALHAPGAIADPVLGANDYGLRWIARCFPAMVLPCNSRPCSRGTGRHARSAIFIRPPTAPPDRPLP